MNKKRIVKNITVLCLGIFALSLAYDGLAMLQSTMNQQNNVGVKAQAVFYGFYCLSALLLPKFFIQKLGAKVTFVLSILSCIPYIASNYYPYFVVMIPASILIGLGCPLMWCSQATYLNDISVMYAELHFSDKKQSNSTTSLNANKNYTNYTQSNSDVLRPTYVNPLKPGQVKEGIGDQQSFEKSNSQRIPKSSNLHTRHATTKSEDLANKDIVSIFGDVEYNGYTEKGQDYDELEKKQMIDTITTKVFGIHGMSFLSCLIFSNLMSYVIFSSTMDSKFIFSNNSAICGAHHCNAYTNFSIPVIAAVSNKTRYTLTTVCVILAVVSAVIVGIFLDPLKSEAKENSSYFQLFIATFKLIRHKEILLLVPLTLYLGQIQGFYIAEFTKAFVSCSWGTHNVSLVSVGYGFFCALSASLSGWLIKIFGRLLVFTAISLLTTVSTIVLLFWVPNPNHPEMYFIIAGMMGIYNGTAWPQLKALYGLLFRADEDAAFAAFHLWFSLGFCISFAYNAFICTYVKLYVLLILSSLGYIGYALVESKFVTKTIKK